MSFSWKVSAPFSYLLNLLMSVQRSEGFSSANVIKVINLKVMRLVGYEERTGNVRHAYSILVGKPEVEKTA
jgi:hypothetical protein